MPNKDDDFGKKEFSQENRAEEINLLE